MAKQSLEERVTALERQMADLAAAVANGEPNKDWEGTVGMFSGDEVMRRICNYALRYREKDREKARRRYERSEPKKK